VPGMHAGMLAAWLFMVQQPWRTNICCLHREAWASHNKDGLRPALHSLLGMWRCRLQAACSCWHHVSSSAAGAARMLSPAGRRIYREEHAALHTC
jgi:hypothetical protein